MTDDEFDKILKESLMESVMEDLGPIWRGEQQLQEENQPPMDATPEKLERTWQLAHQRQEEKENGPPEDI